MVLAGERVAWRVGEFVDPEDGGGEQTNGNAQERRNRVDGASHCGNGTHREEGPEGNADEQLAKPASGDESKWWRGVRPCGECTQHTERKHDRRTQCRDPKTAGKRDDERADGDAHESAFGDEAELNSAAPTGVRQEVVVVDLVGTALPVVHVIPRVRGDMHRGGTHERQHEGKPRKGRSLRGIGAGDQHRNDARRKEWSTRHHHPAEDLGEGLDLWLHAGELAHWERGRDAAVANLHAIALGWGDANLGWEAAAVLTYEDGLPFVLASGARDREPVRHVLQHHEAR